MKKISFKSEGLTLEEVIRLVFFDKNNQDFNTELKQIIALLRKYSSHIKSIGYDVWDDMECITVRLKVAPENKELDNLNKRHKVFNENLSQILTE